MRLAAGLPKGEAGYSTSQKAMGPCCRMRADRADDPVQAMRRRTGSPWAMRLGTIEPSLPQCVDPAKKRIGWGADQENGDRAPFRSD